MHTGLGNTAMNYAMGGTILRKIVKEKYPWVTVNANMKVSEQSRIAASNSNQFILYTGMESISQEWHA